MVKRVVVADDHGFTASGMAEALSSLGGMEVVSIASNGIEAIALIKKHAPDFAIIDLSMPGANGLEVFVEAKRWSPDTRFAIITGNSSPQLFEELVNAGIDGLFLKSAPVEEICAGINKISQFGEQVISKAAQEMLDNVQQEPQKKESLTPRELEVLHAIARGLSNTQIADHLGISAKTVDSHRTSLMRKMGVHSTATLLVQAMRDSLIDVADTD